MIKWTDEELAFLLQNLTHRPIEVYGRFAQEFGADARTYDAVQKQLRKLRETTEEVEEDIEQEDSEEVLIPSNANPLLSQLQPYRLANRTRAAIERRSAEEFIDELVSLSEEIPVFRERPGPSGGSSLVILLSDTHCGKKTKCFNSQIFTDRILSIADKLDEDGVLPADVEEIVLVLAGDMIEGEDIYHTQAHHIEHAVIDQVQIAIRTFWTLIVTLERKYGVVVRVETVPGNHGRVSRTANGKSNWDNVIYQTLGITAEAVGNENIIVNVNMDTFHTFQVQDKTGMIYHHGTKHTGTPSMHAKHAGWLYTKEYDFMMHGHWHHWEIGTQFGKPIVKNGSLCGEDDLSESMGVFDPPRQGYLLVRAGQPVNQFGFFEWINEEIDE